MVSTKFFSTLTVTKLQSFKVGVSEKIWCRVRVATMTHDHNDTPHAIFNTTSGTCWKVSEVIDFDLKNRNSNLLACFSALICDFSQFNKIPLAKTMKTRVLQIFEKLLFMDS